METHTHESLRAIHGFDSSERPQFRFGAWLARVLKRMRDAERRRHDYNILMEKTERELDDIGLTRSDVVGAVKYGRKLTRRYNRG